MKKGQISTSEKVKKTANLIREKHQENQLDNQQQEGISENVLNQSQSIRNTPSHNKIKLLFQGDERLKSELLDTPPNTLNIKKQFKKPQINQVLPQISQQNNFTEKIQNQQNVQQQPQFNYNNQKTGQFQQQTLQYRFKQTEQFTQNQLQQLKNNRQKQQKEENKQQQKSVLESNLSQYQHQQQLSNLQFNQIESNLEQQDQVQIQNQNSNQNQININLRQKDSSKQQLDQCTNLINSLSTKINVQIKTFSKVQQQLLQELQKILEQYPVEIQYQSKIKQDQDIFLIQVKPQSDNDVSQQLKTIIFYWKYIQPLLQELDTYNIEIDFDINSNQYKLKCNKRQKQQKLIKKFHGILEQQLQNFIILTQKCQYQEEAIQKLQILNEIRIKDILAKEFKMQSSKLIDIDLISNYPQNYPLTQIDKSLKDIVRKYFKHNTVIFSLMDYDTKYNQISIECLQEKLNQILQKLIMYQEYTQFFYVDYQLDINEIQYQIQSITNIDNINFQIQGQSQEVVEGKYYYQIIYKTWMLKSDLSKTNKQLQDLKMQIENIINPIIGHEIQDQEQKNIWNKYIRFQYNKGQIKVNRLNDSIIIKFIAEKQQNLKNKGEILEKLQNLKYSQVEFTLDQLTLSILKQQETKKIFEHELEQLKASHKIAYLQTCHVDELQKMIIFEAIYQGHSEGFVIGLLQEKIINQIIIKKVNINFNKIFEYQKKSKEKYEQIYKCYTYIRSNQTTYVTLQENVMNIKKSIEEYKQVFGIEIFIQIRKKLKNKLQFEDIQQIIQNNNNKLEIEYDENDNTIIFKGPQHFVYDSIRKLESLLQNKLQQQK